MMSYDPIADFMQHDRWQSAWLGKRPVCSWCYHHIQDERLWEVNGEFYHGECAREKFEKDTEDFVL